MQTATPPTAPPMIAAKLESDSDFGAAITAGVDRGVVVVSRAEANVGASMIVAAGRPASVSAALRLLAVRLVDIAVAALSFWACTLVSTRMPAVNKRLRTTPPSFMSMIRSMLTSVLDTPAARATDCLNVICALLLNSCLLIGSDTVIFTTYAAGWGVVNRTVVASTGVVVVSGTGVDVVTGDVGVGVVGVGVVVTATSIHVELPVTFL